MQSSNNELRDLLLSCYGDQRNGSRPTQEKVPSRRSSARVAVITSLPAEVLEEHKVSFLARNKSCSTIGKGDPLEELPPPQATGAREREKKLHPKAQGFVAASSLGLRVTLSDASLWTTTSFQDTTSIWSASVEWSAQARTSPLY